MSATIWKCLPLSEYLSLMGNAVEDESKSDKENDADSSILQYLSDRNQEKGRKILTALRESEDFKWDTTGDVFYKGSKIPNAHISDLLSISLRTLPIKSTKLAGLSEYMTTIKALNAPQTLFTAPFLKLLDKYNFERKPELGWKKFSEMYSLK